MTGGAWVSSTSKVEHFVRHLSAGDCCGAVDADDYERKAVAFLCRPPRPHVLCCTRQDRDGCPSDRLRYDPISREFGILLKTGRVLTYYEPHPMSKAYPRGHTNGTNENYFQVQCNRPT